MTYISRLNFKYYMKSNLLVLKNSLKENLKSTVFLFAFEILTLLGYNFAQSEATKKILYYCIAILLGITALYFAFMLILIPLSTLLLYLFLYNTTEKRNRIFVTKINNVYITEVEYSLRGKIVNTTSLPSNSIYKIYVHKDEIYLFVNKYQMQILAKELILDGEIEDIIEYYLYNFTSKISKI